MSNNNHYSLSNDWYQKVNKFGFTAALNIADDNCQSAGSKVLLSEVQRSKGDITDDQISNIAQAIACRLRDIRDYFSHYYHDVQKENKANKKNTLVFEENDPVKEFLETLFEKAVSNVAGGMRESDYEGVKITLFETYHGDYKINAAGVIFLASFFCHRSNVFRMLGAVKGFKRTDKKEMDDGQKRDYNFTRKVLSYYSLRDSYAVKSDETRSFRELLGYLSRVPQQAVDWLNEQKELSEDEQKEFLGQPIDDERDDSKDEKKKRRSLRKTDKFMLFAVTFVEDWAKTQRDMDVTFARYRKRVTPEENKNQDGKQVRDVKFLNDIGNVGDGTLDSQWPLYLRNDHAIIRIQLPEKDTTTARISENELKYLVLLIFEDKGKKAIEELRKYIFEMHKKIRNEWRYKPDEERRIPSFVKNLDHPVTAEAVKNRVEYIRKTVQDTMQTIDKENPGENIWLIYKGKKISMILKFIADSIGDIKKRPNVKHYNELREMLQKLEFDQFYKELQSYVNDGRITAGLYDAIKGIKDISALCRKICELTREKLYRLEPAGGSALYQYIGLEPQEKQANYEEKNTHQEKAEGFLKSQFSIGKNLLRETFYPQHCQKQTCIDKNQSLNTPAPNRKSLAAIIKDTLKGIGPLHDERWYLMDKNPKDYDRQTGKPIRALCNTWVQDVLCMRMAQWYYEKLSPSLRKNIEWDQTGSGYGYERFKLLYKTDCGVTIEFQLADLTRLDILEKTAMIENICKRFIKDNRKVKFGKNHTVNWYDFNQKGVNAYRNRQGQALRSIFAFEETLGIPEKEWRPQGYVPFNKNSDNQQMRFHVLEEAVKKGKIQDCKKEAIRQVRNDFFHENFKSTDDQLRIFEECLPLCEDDKKKAEKKRSMYKNKR